MKGGKRRHSTLLAMLVGAFSILLIPVSSEAQVTGLSGWNIYLDPGHSRTENMGIYGYSEAEKNLRVALALRELLLEKTDIDTVYISRMDDQVSVSLSQRSDHANSLGAAWFHSIHSDAGSPSTNSTLLLWGQLLDGREKNPPGGQAMSDIMSSILTRGMRIGERGSIGDCSFYRSFNSTACSGGGPYLSVNRRTTMPSELSEAGFHTNPTQNQRNMNADWKRLEAWTFFWSILEHHGIERPDVSILTGIVTDVETGRPINDAEITIAGQTYLTDGYESLFNRYSSDPDQLSNGVFYLEDLTIAPGKTAAPMNVNADGYLSYVGEISLVDSFFTFADVELIPSAPPIVASSTPDSGETLRIVDPIRITFSRAMDRPSTEAAFGFQPPLTGNFVWSSNFAVTFQPDSIRATTDYSMTISGSATGVYGDLLDGDGDGLPGGDFTLQFTTGFPDFQPPRIVASDPRQRMSGADLLPVISFTFDEPLDSTSISENMVSLIPSAGGEPIAGRFEHYVIGEQSVPTFFPQTRLEPQTQYQYTLEAGVTDRFGNAVTSPKTLEFTTGSTEFDLTTVDAFEGTLDDWWLPQQSGSTTGILTNETDRSPDSSIVNHLTGSQSAMRLDYGWDTTAGDWLIRTYLSGGAPRLVQFDSTYVVEAYLFGDGSGNLFRFALDDRVPAGAAGNHEVSPWIPVDWYGWRHVSWSPSADGAGTWLGDGSFDGTLRFDSIQLSYAPGSPNVGTFYLDDLKVAKKRSAPVATEYDEVPSAFSLYQNYPNPFNPTTHIQFDVPDAGAVSLKIYTVTGSEVATLIDGSRLSAGRHEVMWDASQANLPSGTYFARLTADGKSAVVRMVLLK